MKNTNKILAAFSFTPHQGELIDTIRNPITPNKQRKQALKELNKNVQAAFNNRMHQDNANVFHNIATPMEDIPAREVPPPPRPRRETPVRVNLPDDNDDDLMTPTPMPAPAPPPPTPTPPAPASPPPPPPAPAPPPAPTPAPPTPTPTPKKRPTRRRVVIGPVQKEFTGAVSPAIGTLPNVDQAETAAFRANPDNIRYGFLSEASDFHKRQRGERPQEPSSRPDDGWEGARPYTTEQMDQIHMNES